MSMTMMCTQMMSEKMMMMMLLMILVIVLMKRKGMMMMLLLTTVMLSMCSLLMMMMMMTELLLMLVSSLIRTIQQASFSACHLTKAYQPSSQWVHLSLNIHLPSAAGAVRATLYVAKVSPFSCLG